MRVGKRYILIFITFIVFLGVMMVFSTKVQTLIGSETINLPSPNDLPVEDWAKLAEKKIYFGHQSVGYNIIDGIEDIIRQRGDIELKIVETFEPAEFQKPIFAHSQVGRNTEPSSKINSFVSVMDSGVGNSVDIAFFKFCYVDIMRDSNPQKIFDLYRSAIEGLQRQYPETIFLHVTVPLCSTPKGTKKNLRASLKRLIGKPGVLDDNIKRERYNELLRNAYSKTGLVFDLALIETVNSESRHCYAVKGEEKVPVMAAEYTDDGGHLNNIGRKKVAEQLLIKLAELANKS